MMETVTAFSNGSPAIFGAGFNMEKTAMNRKGDVRNLPSEKKKKKHKNRMMTSLSHPGLSPTRSLSLQDTWDPGFIIAEPADKGVVCACIRSTDRLHVPESWIYLTDVQELTIEDEDNAVKIIPPEIYELRKLRMLTIRYSGLQFVGAELSTMPLTQVNLSTNRLERLPLVNHRTITVLNLAENMIRTLPEDIGTLLYLRDLNLSGNQITCLPDSIANLKMLNELTLTSNNIMSLPEAIGELSELRCLDLSLNKIEELPDSLGSLVNLVTLLLSSNRLSHIPDSFGGLGQLKFLYIRKNKFTEVPAVLLGLPLLEVLNMSENRITTIAAASPTLKHLLLNANLLMDVPENILDSTSLETLSLERNTITRLPEEIRRLISLRALHLCGNEMAELPGGVGELQELRHLTLNDTEIEHLPSRMESLHRLSVLKLENTRLDGAWMSAYRQGIPAVLEYAKSIRIRASSVDARTSPGGKPACPPKPQRRDKHNIGLSPLTNGGLAEIKESPRWSPDQQRKDVANRKSLASPLPNGSLLRAKPVEEISRPKSSPIPLRSED